MYIHSIVYCGRPYVLVPPVLDERERAPIIVHSFSKYFVVYIQSCLQVSTILTAESTH